MDLTDRDRTILHDIQDYGLLTSKLIASRHFPGVQITTVLRRLRMLEDSKYIQRIDGLENNSTAWFMARVGAHELNGRAAKTSFPQNIVEHDLALMKLRLRLEECGIARAWIAEHVLRKKIAASHSYRSFRQVSVPDGLMGFESHRGNRLTYAIELEMTAKNQKRYRDIFKQYERRNCLHAYWYIVRKPTIGTQIAKASRQGTYRYGNREPFLFWSLLEDVMGDPLNSVVHAHDWKGPLGDLIKSSEQSAHDPAQGMGIAKSNPEQVPTP